jgi:hypothetical protein
MIPRREHRGGGRDGISVRDRPGRSRAAQGRLLAAAQWPSQWHRCKGVGTARRTRRRRNAFGANQTRRCRSSRLPQQEPSALRRLRQAAPGRRSVDAAAGAQTVAPGRLPAASKGSRGPAGNDSRSRWRNMWSVPPSLCCSGCCYIRRAPAAVSPAPVPSARDRKPGRWSTRSAVFRRLRRTTRSR